MIKNHLWVLEALRDIEDYSRLNDLPELAQYLRDADRAFAKDVAAVSNADGTNKNSRVVSM